MNHAPLDEKLSGIAQWELERKLEESRQKGIA
jgi:hypothetical protein